MADNFWLFNLSAKSAKEALKKARREAHSYGDVARIVKKIKKQRFSAFGGKRKRNFIWR